MSTHTTGAVTDGPPLHPSEMTLVQQSLNMGMLVRRCSCGFLAAGDTESSIALAMATHLR